MSRITVSSAARRWIEDHGGALTIRASTRNGCCGGQAVVPVAEARTPADHSDYGCHMLDGLSVYVGRELAGLEVRVGIDRLGPWSRLYAEAPILPGGQPEAGDG